MFNKIATFIAAIAMMAITSNAMAGGPPSNISFSGNVSRSDHQLGWVTVAGTMAGTPNIGIHVVDGQYDTYCHIVDPAGISITNTSPTSGTIDLYPANCYQTRKGISSLFPVPANSQLSFDWYRSGWFTGWNVAAYGMNLMLPGFCDYDGFAGVGSVTN